MAVTIAIPRENRPLERRVALVPAVAAKLAKLGAELRLEAGAGDAALIPDALYAKAGVAIGAHSLDADVVLKAQPPSLDEARALREGSVLFSFVYAHREAELVKLLRDRKIPCF